MGVSNKDLGKGTKEKQASIDIVGFASSMPQKEA
jgi:hypothetical protein